jgi:hypothetical protein
MPLTNLEVVTAFGDPRPLMKPDGGIRPEWGAITLAMFALPAPLPLANGLGVATHVTCHHRIVPFMQWAFMRVFLDQPAWASLHDYEGCYAWRSQRAAPGVLSRHAWGLAVDLNALENPFMAPPTMHPGVVAAFKAQGFEWGGEWHHRPDGMHFEFADLSRLTPAPAPIV